MPHGKQATNPSECVKCQRMIKIYGRDETEGWRIHCLQTETNWPDIVTRFNE